MAMNALQVFLSIVMGGAFLTYFLGINVLMGVGYVMEELAFLVWRDRNHWMCQLGRRYVLRQMRRSSRAMLFALEDYGGVTMEFTGDKCRPYTNAILLANHVNSIDFIAIKSSILRSGMLRHTKFLAKESLKWVPGLGWGMLLTRQIMLRRKWDSDKESIERTFHSLQHGRWPLTLCLFLEGTRITPSKLKQSQEFARQRDRPHWERIMCPRVRGFQAAVRQLTKDNYVEYIYDLTFGYCSPGMKQSRNAMDAISLSDLLGRGWKGCKDSKLIIDIKEHKIQDIPIHDDKLLTDWCFEQWQRKEEMLEALYSDPKNLAEEDPLKWHFPSDRKIIDWPMSVKEASDDIDEPYRRQARALKNAVTDTTETGDDKKQK